MSEETTFYGELQKTVGLDLRDNRGKKHDLSFVLLSLLIGLLRHRDGNLSSIHRSMYNMHEALCTALSVDIEGVISRAQLPRLLCKVNRSIFERLLFKHYGIELKEEEKKWFAGDGKELRGSIDKGDKRGEVVVQLVSHEDRQVAAQSFYNGTKESEKPCLRALIQVSGLISQQITADALHLNPETTEPIEQGGGVFLIGLKENQKELLQDMKDHIACFNSVVQKQTVEKGHGRIDIRQYTAYDVEGEYFEERWNKSGFTTLIVVERSRNSLKTNTLTDETSFYISNAKSKEYEDYFAAIRNHWSVEVNNHYRDVTLKEDQLRTKKSQLQEF